MFVIDFFKSPRHLVLSPACVPTGRMWWSNGTRFIPVRREWPQRHEFCRLVRFQRHQHLATLPTCLAAL